MAATYVSFLFIHDDDDVVVDDDDSIIKLLQVSLNWINIKIK